MKEFLAPWKKLRFFFKIRSEFEVENRMNFDYGPDNYDKILLEIVVFDENFQWTSK